VDSFHQHTEAQFSGANAFQYFFCMRFENFGARSGHRTQSLKASKKLGAHMSRSWNWLREEFWQILPVWIFFFVSFGLVALNRMAIFAEYHIKPAEPPEFLVGSLIMAKVVLLIDAFFKREGWERRPLIYFTLWNTGLYFVAALAFHHIEQVFSLIRRQHVGIAAANHEVLLAMAKPTFAAIMASVLVLTFVFCTLRELVHATGHERFMEMFFGRRPRRRSEAEDIRRAG
jgi:hypothetical protein